VSSSAGDAVDAVLAKDTVRFLLGGDVAALIAAPDLDPLTRAQNASAADLDVPARTAPPRAADFGE